MLDHYWEPGAPLRFGVGIEDTFIPQLAVGQRKLDEYELTGHYTHWEQDLELVAKSGASFIRWGVPWYLVEPERGKFDWSWVDEVAAKMEELGLRPVVDLMHYGTPLWLDNSFINSDYVELVAAYGAAVADRYRGVWNDYTPLNEPVVNAEWCGRDGRWPPYLSGDDGFVKITLQLARGMIRTQQEIAAVLPTATFVHVDAGFRYRGETSPHSREHLEARRFLPLDLITGRIDESTELYSYLRDHGFTDEDATWFKENSVEPDVMGVNYYPGFSTLRVEDGITYPVAAGSEGLRDLLTLYWERYRKPLVLTETSLTGTSEEKAEWLKESVREIQAMRNQGIPVLGTTWFPFMTLVDWLYRYANDTPDYWFRHMGLIDLVRQPNLDLKRVPNSAFNAFRRLSNSEQLEGAERSE